VPLKIIVISKFSVIRPSYWLLPSPNEYEDNLDYVVTTSANTDGNQRLVNTNVYDIRCAYNNPSSFTAY